MKRNELRVFGLIVLLALAALPAFAQQAESGAGSQPASAEQARAEPAGDPAVRARLDAIRDDLVQLRLEQALASIEALLGDPTMSAEDRTEAIVLRAQVHASFGDFDALESDYREILQARPGYRPESSLTPEKGMKRFRKVRDELVGTLRFELDPADARVLIDGRQVVIQPDGSLAVLGGARSIRAEARGFDPEVYDLEVTPGQELPVRMQLVPNARDVVVRTIPAGVDVYVDGAQVGRTEAPVQSYGRPSETGELLVPNLPLGEHQIEYRKPCFADHAVRDIVTVDLLDRAAKVYEPVRMRPSFASLRITGEPLGAAVRINGEDAGFVPVEEAKVCPGRVVIEVEAGKRIVWRDERTAREEVAASIEITPRPNVALIGADRWPGELQQFSGLFNAPSTTEAPSGVDLTGVDGWMQLELPRDTDLALAVLPPLRRGGADRWFLWSPVLRTVTQLEAAPEECPRPSWQRTVWGLTVADSRLGGKGLVVEVAVDGAAARAGVQIGDRVLAIDGEEMASSAMIRGRLEQAGAQSRTFQLMGPGAAPREVEITGDTSPVLLASGEREGLPAVLAAWAAVDAVAFPDRAAAALGNLAMLQSESGNATMAAESWRRVRWGDRKGINAGTASYYLGRELAVLGREREAIDAFRAALGAGARTFTDEGPQLAPAAQDHLTDLGESVD